MVNKKIKYIRKDLDKLDNSILNLVKKRATLVKMVLKQKKYKNQIIDKKRIKKILTNIRKRSLNKKIDPKITNKIWKSMIYAFIDFEFRNFKKK
jgi:chorismate mutase